MHREDGGARILDDRSLNGVFVNGERVDMRELGDGDEVTVGRFWLYFLSLRRPRCATGAPRPAARSPELAASGRSAG